MFVRIYRPNERKEVLVNVNHISKLEVEYAVKGEDGDYHSLDAKRGLADPGAARFFRFEVSGEEFLLQADPNDPVMKVFDEIYKSAIKG